MFRSRVGYVVRPGVVASSTAFRVGTSSSSAASPLLTTWRWESSTPSVSHQQQQQRPRSGVPPSASSFSQKVKMASTSSAAAHEKPVRPVTPPTAEADGGDPADGPARKVVKRKKIIKKVLRRSTGETEVLSSETVNTGEALRRELRFGGATTHGSAAAAAEEDETSAASEAAAAVAGAAETASTAPATKAQKTSLVKGYKIDEVTSLCTPSDAIFARRLPAGGCQFFAWPGTPLNVASAAIVSMPDTIRTVHAVFGRFNTPIDLVMDIDCPVPQEHWSMSKIRPFQKNLLDDTLSVVAEEIGKIGEKIETQVVLQSPNLKKASFHVHTKLKDAAFADFNALHGFLARFHERIPTVDLQIYRPNGMLRMFSCMKENHTSAMTVFDEPEWNIGFKDGKVPDEAAAMHSVIVRPAGTFKRLLRFDAPRHAYVGHGAGGARASWPTRADGKDRASDSHDESAIRPVVLLPRTEREAIENASRWLRSATEVEVGEWRSWIGLGICAFRLAYQFKDATTLPRPAMEEMLEAWVEASRHCPSKFRVGDCERCWASFDFNKLSTQSDWWAAYLRLGRLEVPAKESIAQQEAERARQTAPRSRKAAPQKR